MAYLAIKLNQQKDYPIVCKVVLLPEKRYYVPGDYVEGKLVVSHRREGMSVRGLKIVLQGSSYAKFQEREQIHHKSDIFLAKGVYVFGGELPTKTRLPTGTHSYPFKLQIPTTPQFPSSFKSSFGMSIYQVLGLVDIGPQMLKKGEKTIEFRSCLEIGPDRGIDCEKSLKNLKYIFKTDSSGFAIGQELRFTLNVVNAHEHDIKYAMVSLVQKVTYFGGNVSRSWKDIFVTIEEVVNETMSEFWCGTMKIGKNLIPSFTGGVIEFRYLLKVLLEVKGQGMTLKSEHPVTIGTSSTSAASAQSPTTETADDALSVDGSVAGPPRYSTLSSRAESFESLLPEYEQLQEGRSSE